MSTNDYVKYMADTIIQRLEAPKSELKERRKERKQGKAPFHIHWFRMMPMSLAMVFKKMEPIYALFKKGWRPSRKSRH